MQYFAVNKSDYGKTSMRGHEGKKVTCLVQCSVVNKSDCGKVSMTGHEEK